MTDAEAKLWQRLRRDQLNKLNFRRQHPIRPYTLDFYCPALRLGIENDGGQHAEQQKQADERRSQWLSAKDIQIVRFWNNDVLGNIQGVLEEIARIAEVRAQAMTPSLTLPLAGGGKQESLP